jgi:LuxR family maltose regulon positive regulatory protein
LSRVWLERGEFEKALRIARKAVALGKVWGQVDNLMMCYQLLAYALSFSGQDETAGEVIREAWKIARNGPPWHLSTMEYMEMHIYLDGDPQDMMEIQQKTNQFSGSLLETSALLRIRTLVKQNRPGEALAELQEQQARTDQYWDYQNTWFYILKALALFQQKENAAALDSLKQALELTRPENHMATFLREGAAMEKLLRLALAKNIAPEFVRQLLAAFEQRRRQKPVPVQAADVLIEPLSERELEVLGHLNSYFSTPEIADLLVLSPNTVRTHIKSIYGKLGVHGRSGAVKRARELGLLG